MTGLRPEESSRSLVANLSTIDHDAPAWKEDPNEPPRVQLPGPFLFEHILYFEKRELNHLAFQTIPAWYDSRDLADEDRRRAVHKAPQWLCLSFVQRIHGIIIWPWHAERNVSTREAGLVEFWEPPHVQSDPKSPSRALTQRKIINDHCPQGGFRHEVRLLGIQPEYRSVKILVWRRLARACKDGR